MALPFLLLGGAVISGGYGLKKAYNAKETSDEADDVQKTAMAIYEKAKRKLTRKRDRVAKTIKSLGEVKLKAASNEIKDFADEFSKIRNLKLTATEGLEELDRLTFTANDLNELKEISINATNILLNGVGSGTAGVLMGYGAYYGVGWLATASTGTAINTLSGIAAKNATLAWLGGGSLASGGGGVALGSVVLGGLVVGPALLLAGSLFNSSANTKFDNAKINRLKAEKYESDVDVVISELAVIQRYAVDIIKIILKLQVLTKATNERLKEAIDNNGTDWNKYDDKAKESVFVAVKAVQGLKAAIDVPLLTEEGVLTAKVRQFVKLGKREYVDL